MGGGLKTTFFEVVEFIGFVSFLGCMLVLPLKVQAAPPIFVHNRMFDKQTNFACFSNLCEQLFLQCFFHDNCTAVQIPRNIWEKSLNIRAPPPPTTLVGSTPPKPHVNMYIHCTQQEEISIIS